MKNSITLSFALITD